jgi:organic radical activating enzyme
MGLVISGGEPLMQLDDALLSALSKRFLWVDIETNGTVDPMFQPTDYPNVYMSCSPKTRRIPEWADWYKLLIPAKLDLLPYVLEAVRRLEEYPPRVPQRLYLQAVEVDGITSSETLANVRQAVDLCLEHGATLSFQAHKLIGIR